MAIKDVKIIFRVTETEKQTISDCASIAGLELSEYIRRCVLVPVDTGKRELFKQMHEKTARIYDEWGTVVDKLSELVKEEKKVIRHRQPKY